MKYKDTRQELGEGLKKILTFIDAEIHHERILNARENQATIRVLESTIHDLRVENELLKRPGIKTATRSLLGSIKRKAIKMHGTREIRHKTKI